MQAVQAKTVRMRVYFCFLGDLRLRSRHLHSHFKICGEAGAIASARCAQEKGNFPSLASASSYIHSCFYCSCVCFYACAGLRRLCKHALTISKPLPQTLFPLTVLSLNHVVYRLAATLLQDFIHSIRP